MKKYVMLIITLLIIATAVVVPKQEAQAKSPLTMVNYIATKARDWVIKKGAEKLTQADEKVIEKITQTDDKENAPQIKSDVSEEEQSGSSMDGTDLSDVTMTPTVHYSAFQDAVSKFISIITVVGGFYLGVSILRSMGMFMISIAKFAMAPTYPRARYLIFKNLLVSIVCIAMLGSVGLLTQLISGVVFGA